MTSYSAELPTSYFSTPASSLDPKLFQGRVLHTQIRTGILTLLNGFLEKEYRHPDLWSHAWLAGSGVSYQWSADRHPADLDCLVGVDFIQFRKANPEYQGLSDSEIAAQINEDFKQKLESTTDNWNGFELTFYVNTDAADIRNINPYAAYDLKYNEWTVTPSPTQKAPVNPSWDTTAASDRSMAAQLSTRYSQALEDMKFSQGGPQRRNAETRLSAAGQQATALYDEIHQNRSEAFSRTGQGYNDFHNYRWQAGKRGGTINLLKSIKKHMEANQGNQYGVELPDTSTLIRRAILNRGN
jgi:hypothetical protein